MITETSVIVYQLFIEFIVKKLEKDKNTPYFIFNFFIFIFQISKSKYQYIWGLGVNNNKDNNNNMDREKLESIADKLEIDFTNKNDEE